MSPLQLHRSAVLHTRSSISCTTLPLRRPQHLSFTCTRTGSLVIQAKKLDSEKKTSPPPPPPATTPTGGQLSATSDRTQSKQSKSKYPTPSDDYFDPGMVPDFWEGPQWNWLGFILRYLWAIGFVVAIITCGILFVTYKPKPRDYRPLPQAPSLEDVENFLEERRSPGSLDESEAPSIESAAPQEEASPQPAPQELQEEVAPESATPLDAGVQVFESKVE